jgi:MoaA/NifB/PqqE/SkfB family radical SAM enzyme
VYCSNCIRAEQYGRSERHWHNDVNQDFDSQSADIDYYDPTIIDIRWNTTCNLSCNYCGEYCSSKWQSIKKSIPVKNAVRPYYQQVCDFLAQHATDIREVALVGGEPLLLPENERLLDVIPKDCIVTLITNTSVTLENNRIFQKVAQRSRVGWSMSFDNIQDRFEYVRHGGEWSKLTHNISLIQDLMKTQGHWGGVHAVYNIYNCSRLVEFREWLHQQGLTVIWQNLFQPDYLDPALHNQDIRTLAADEIDRLLERCHSFMSESELSFFDHARQKFQQEHRDTVQSMSQQFLDHIETNETVYHPDKNGEFVRLWPELESRL